MNPIVIVSAIPEEIDTLLSHYKDNKTEKRGAFTFYHAKHRAIDLIFGTSGVGKVSAAMTTQKLIDEYAPRFILFTGVAGALNPAYAIGDLIIAQDCIQYDIDASELGFLRGAIPYTNYRIFKPDPDLVKQAYQCADSKTVHLGRILTGDLFMTHTQRPQYADIFEQLKGDAIEMEGAALAHVCTHNKTPFLLMRTISDRADAAASIDFNTFLKTASENSFKLIQHFLNALSCSKSIPDGRNSKRITKNS